MAVTLCPLDSEQQEKERRTRFMLDWNLSRAKKSFEFWNKGAILCYVQSEQQRLNWLAGEMVSLGLESLNEIADYAQWQEVNPWPKRSCLWAKERFQTVKTETNDFKQRMNACELRNDINMAMEVLVQTEDYLPDAPVVCGLRRIRDVIQKALEVGS